MFRVKTDLATKTSYAELTPTDESPALYSFCESVEIVSAVFSAVLTAMSSASVYSQDSWKEESPFIPVIKVDPRRMAIAFSPSVQWFDIVEGRNDNKIMAKSPLVHSAFISQPEISFSEVVEDNDTKTHSEPSVVSPVTTEVFPESVGSLLDVGSSGLVAKRLTKFKSRNKNIDEQNARRSTSAFMKAMVHLLFQPSKRELAQFGRADAVAIPNNTLPSINLTLPELQVSPIFHSFIDQINTYSPSSPTPSAPESMATFDILVKEDSSEDVTSVRRLRATMPPPGISSERKTHRRYKSSPAVPYFHRWDKDDMPPLPPMPAGLIKPRAMSVTNGVAI